MKKQTSDIINTIQNIPKGRVATYGQIGVIAGYPNSARQVSWVLKNYTQKYNLPWYRVINKSGKISLPNPEDYNKQKSHLISEGVKFSNTDKIDLNIFLW